MTAAAQKDWTKQRSSPDGPLFVLHESFHEPDADEQYTPDWYEEKEQGTHMPDEVTRNLARRMHYAAYQMGEVKDPVKRKQWRKAYLTLRDRIVMGNHKLIYRAVRRWNPPQSYADDLVGDCQIVLIQAVAAYNPWLGVRFSTYAFTCLMRALARITQRRSADRLAWSLPLDCLLDGEPHTGADEGPSTKGMPRIEEYLSENNGLLTPREKQVLLRRFQLDDTPRAGTLEEVGRELGLSKERVRQVQLSALGKLREALAPEGVAQ